MHVPVSDQRPLDGKSVVVTGAARGIGAAFARFAVTHGAQVVLADIDSTTVSQLARELRAGGQAVAVTADVASPDDVAAVVRTAVSEFGGLDGMVNNAALATSMGDVGEFDEMTVRRMVGVNLLGCIWGTEAAAAVMRPAGRGSIVNMTSGAHAGVRHRSVYGATKGGVASYTYGAAIDLAPHGIRANAVSPMGLTQMVTHNDAYRSRHGIDAPTAPSLPADNNAAAIAFLLSDLAEEVTGQVLRIDHEGLSIVRRPRPVEGSLVPGRGWSFSEVAEAYRDRLRDYVIDADMTRSQRGKAR